MKFVDLFAGLGGFHLALGELGHECVFASELNEELRSLYIRNFAFEPVGDLRKHFPSIPAHDILCAGFPCQPFSKAGGQRGTSCPNWGDLFDYVLRILDLQKPRFLILENVPNLVRHDSGRTWARMRASLERRGYEVSTRELSPDTIGIPQHRNRTFIVGSIEGLSGFDWERVSEKVDSFSLADLLDKEPEEAKFLLPLNRGYLQTWQEFLDLIPSEAPLPSFPVWAMEFGATYPFEEQHPLSMSGFDLNAYKGAMGVSLRGLSGQNLASALPKYINNCTELPTWKKRFIRQNRQFFEYHRSKLEPWLDKIREFPPSFQKFEWTWKDGPRKLSETLVQFRASGIRVKRPDRAPSLVAMTSSQVPIVAAEGRYMTVRECARLQSMEGLSELPRTETGAYRALGNAVNVKLVKRIAEELLANVDHDVADSSYRHLPESYDTLHVG